jgi:hypothetical protein
MPDDPVGAGRIEALQKELERDGWIVGRNIAIDVHYSSGYPRVSTNKRRGPPIALHLALRQVVTVHYGSLRGLL